MSHQWPQTFHPPPPRPGPPPAKKVKNNPVITRYPPPPGYSGPMQPQAQHWRQTPAWPAAALPYTYGQQTYSGYPAQAYGPTQPYQQPPYAGYQQHPQWPQTAYPAVGQNPYPDPSAAPSAWSEPMYAGSPPNGFPDTQAPQRRHFSAPSLTYRPDFGQFVETENVALKHPASSEDLEEDFYDECYFAAHPEEIDPKFSLGMIEWKAPLPTKRPLPSTFAEAELEALAPRKPLPSDEESISEYFIKSKRHEAFLSVRQTEYWKEVQGDVVFMEFPVVCSRLLPMPELLAKYKDRPDPTWAARVYSPTPDPEGSGDADGAAMELSSAVAVEDTYEQSDMLGNLEQAVRQNGAGHKRRHSRASSTTSVSSHRAKRPKPLIPVRDQAQEDTLAALGVTGSPKLVYETPGPAIGAPPPQQHNGPALRGSRHNSITSNNGALDGPHLLQHAGQGQRNHTGYSTDRRASDSSHHTAMGSDFEDNEATPRPKYHGKDYRKRTHEDSGDDRPSYLRYHDDEETPKPRRKQPRVDDPYHSRRW